MTPLQFSCRPAGRNVTCGRIYAKTISILSGIFLIQAELPSADFFTVQRTTGLRHFNDTEKLYAMKFNSHLSELR